MHGMDGMADRMAGLVRLKVRERRQATPVNSRKQTNTCNVDTVMRLITLCHNSPGKHLLKGMASVKKIKLGVEKSSWDAYLWVRSTEVVPASEAKAKRHCLRPGEEADYSVIE